LQTSSKVVIDTDAGADDAVALFLALAAHKDQSKNFEILGITTVSGNTGVDYVCRNVGIVLEYTGIEVRYTVCKMLINACTICILCSMI